MPESFSILDFRVTTAWSFQKTSNGQADEYDWSEKWYVSLSLRQQIYIIIVSPDR